MRPYSEHMVQFVSKSVLHLGMAPTDQLFWRWWCWRTSFYSSHSSFLTSPGIPLGSWKLHDTPRTIRDGCCRFNREHWGLMSVTQPDWGNDNLEPTTGSRGWMRPMSVINVLLVRCPNMGSWSNMTWVRTCMFPSIILQNNAEFVKSYTIICDIWRC